MQNNQTFSELQLEDELNVIFNNDTALINEWLDTPIPRLDGLCPRSLLVTNEKREKLAPVLQEMKFGGNDLIAALNINAARRCGKFEIQWRI